MGVKIWGDGWQTGIMDGISGGAGADDIDDMADAAEDLSSGLDDSTDSAKKLKKALTVLPFDELNKLNDNSDTSSSSKTPTSNSSGGVDSGAIDLSGAISDALADYESVWNAAIAKSQNKAQEFADAITNAFSKKDWTSIGTSLGTKIRDGLNSIPWGTIQATASDMGTRLATLINGAVTVPNVGNAVGNTIAQGINTGISFVLSFTRDLDWGAVGSAVSDGINTMLMRIRWQDAITSAKNIGTGIATALNNIITPKTLTNVGKAIANLANTVITGMKNFVKKANFKEWGNSLGDGFMALVDNIKWDDFGTAVGGMIQGAMDLIGGFIEKLDFDDIKSKLEEFFENVGKEVDMGKLGTALATVFGTWLTIKFVASVGSEVFKKVAEKIVLKLAEKLVEAELITSFTTAISGFGSAVLGAVGTAITTAASVGTALLPVAGIVMAAVAGAFIIYKNWDKIKEFGGKVIDKIKEGIDKAKDAWEYIKGIPGKIKDKLGDAKDWLKEKGSAAMEGLKNKMQDVSENKIKPFLSGVGEKVKTWAGNSKEWLKDKGTDAMESMHSAMDKVKNSKIYNIASNLGKNIKDKVGDTKDWLSDKGKKAMDGMRSAMQAIRDGDLKRLTTMLGSNLKGNIGNLSNLLHSTGQNVMNGLKSGINSAMGALTSLVGSIPNRIRDSIGNLYNIGYNAIQSFRNGFTSIRIPLPHINVGWNQHSVGGLSFSTPSFGINWYAKGGILDGAQIFGKMGNSLLGGGEAGKEAVLPLDRNTGWMDDIAERVSARTGGFDSDNLYSQMYMAMVDANEKQNAKIDRMISVMEGILEKDTTIEVTSASIATAQEKTNRRHGRTIVPVDI